MTLRDLLIAVFGFLAKWALDQFVAFKTRREDREHGLLKAAVESLHAGGNASQQRRLEAVEALWDEILRVDRTTSVAYFVLDTPNRPMALNEMRVAIQQIDRDQIVSALFVIEKHRPFAGESLTAACKAFVVLAVGIVMDVQEAANAGIEKLQDNRNARMPAVQAIIGSNESITDIDALRKMKDEILRRTQKLISGEVVAAEGYQLTNDLQRIIDQSARKVLSGKKDF